jgi:type I restriction enzyme M protein
VVLGLLRDDLAAKLDGHVARWQRELTASYETWEQKYAVSLKEIRAGRERSVNRLDGFLKELGYAE